MSGFIVFPERSGGSRTLPLTIETGGSTFSLLDSLFTVGIPFLLLASIIAVLLPRETTRPITTAVVTTPMITTSTTTTTTTATTPCDSNPRRSGGSCIATGLSYRCDCPREFSGDNCEVLKTCPVGWLQYDYRCYYFSSDTMNWLEAMGTCATQNSILAEPMTTAAIEFLKTVAEDRGQTFWLGGTDIQNEGDWIWATSQTSITVTDWGGGERQSQAIRGETNIV